MVDLFPIIVVLGGTLITHALADLFHACLILLFCDIDVAMLVCLFVVLLERIDKQIIEQLVRRRLDIELLLAAKLVAFNDAILFETLLVFPFWACSLLAIFGLSVVSANLSKPVAAALLVFGKI